MALKATDKRLQRDVLDALIACAASYDPHTISTYSITIWDALKFEVFNAQEDELCQLALSCLQEVSRTLNKPAESKDLLLTFLKPVASECNDRLSEIQQKQAQSAALIVGSLGSTSTLALSTLAQACLPPLLKMYREASSFEARRAILDVTSEIIEGATKIQGTEARSPSPLAAFKDDLFQTFSQALMGDTVDETALRLAAMNCLMLSCLSPSLLDSGEIGMVVQYLDEIILTTGPEVKPVLRDRAIESVSKISFVAERPISEIAIPAFLAHLPDSIDAPRTAYGSLNSIARLNLSRQLISTLLRRLLNKAKVLSRLSCTGSYLQAVLATIYLVLGQAGVTDDVNEIQTYFEHVVELIIIVSQQAGEDARHNMESQVPITLGRLTARILRSMSAQNQLAASQQLFGILSHSSAPRAQDLSRTAPRILLTYVMAVLRKEVRIQRCRSNVETDEGPEQSKSDRR